LFVEHERGRGRMEEGKDCRWQFYGGMDKEDMCKKGTQFFRDLWILSAQVDNVYVYERYFRYIENDDD